jgi:hypothetical protein
MVQGNTLRGQQLLLEVKKKLRSAGERNRLQLFKRP